MFKNYFKVAFRNLWKNKGFSGINIIGLALGLACSLLILLWVQDERSVDAFHKNGARLFYVYERNFMNNKIETWIWTQGPLAEELKKNIPEIEAATPMSWPGNNNFSVGNKKVKENGYAANGSFFNMFSYPLIAGTAADALCDPGSIAISRKMATELYGSPVAAIGKPLRYENQRDFTVKAVFEDLPSNVSSPFNYIMSWSGYLKDNDWATFWGAVDPRTVIQLRADANPDAVAKKLTRFLDAYPTDQKTTIRKELGLQRFDQNYLYRNYENGYPSAGRVEYVRLFSIVALFILLIACINFMNLTTARSINRGKEIGIRKVVGAKRGLLIRQFIGEALLMAILSMTLAIVLVLLALPAFNDLTGKQIVLPVAQWNFWLSIVSLALLTGLFSGSYPAFFLSAFNPIRVLKGSVKTSAGAVWFRKGLVVFQFVLSITLIISTLLISRQVRYLQSAKLGYDRENLLYIPIEGDMSKNLNVFTAAALHKLGISNISTFTEEPTEMNNGILGFGWEGKDPNEQVRFIADGITPNFFNTMKMKLVAGRELSPAYPTDTSGVILNETALKLIGYKDPIGKLVSIYQTKLHIVGIVEDFHFRSLHDPIQPLVLYQSQKGRPSTLLVRTQPGKTKEALASLEALSKELNPQIPFTYKFSDQEYAKLYKSETVIGSLSVIFAVLAIVISCLGLLGLSIFTAAQRTREVGIRKVLGASVASLLTLLSADFIKLVAIAFAIAAPLGWWAMHNWLNNFAYRTDIPWWTFVISGVVTVAIALGTVCIQGFQTAGVNPVKSLRSE